MLCFELPPIKPMLPAFSDLHRPPLLHVAGGASAVGLLKQTRRTLQEQSKQQGIAAKSAKMCTAVTNGILKFRLGHEL